MGVGAIELRVRGKVDGADVVLAETGQRLPIRGAPAASTKPWLVFMVEGWKPDEQLVLAFREERDAP